jgi:uncharacterized protein involved in exopolysaccharide biosynthesis
MFYMQPQLPNWAQLEVMSMYLEAMLIFIEAMAFSPENVSDLIQELDLYPELEGRVAKSTLLAKFKNNYSITYDYTEVPTKYGRTEEVVTGFTFTFDHVDPRKAYYVANALATTFVELFRKFREGSSARSETFFEAERERLRREMAVIDQKVSNFKQKHVTELPELFQLNYRMLERITDKLFQIEEKLISLRSRKGAIEAELSVINPTIGMVGLSGQRIVSTQERLAAMQLELEQLRARYSDLHPDVRRAKNEIEKLQVLVEEEKAGKGKQSGQAGPKGYGLAQAEGAYNPVFSQLTLQLEQIEADMATLRAEEAELEKEQKEYERRIGITPLVEKEWLILTRDRDAIQARFNNLAQAVQTMESASEMEKRELGGRLSIGRPPVIPSAPYKPNIPMIITAAAFLGLLSGAGLLLGWDYLNKTVRTQNDLLLFHDSTVLVELPMITAGAEISRFRINKTYARLAVLVLCIGVVVAVDLYYMKVDVLIVKLLNLVKTKVALMGF